MPVPAPARGHPRAGAHVHGSRTDDDGATALDLYATTAFAFDLDTTMLVDMFAVRATTVLYGPVDRPRSRYDRAVEILSRRLGLDGPDAERLLLAHLGPPADPLGVADRITRRFGGRAAPVVDEPGE